MIVPSDLLDMEREISRGSFLRRIFAIGAGIAASGALMRAADALASHTLDSAYGVNEWHRVESVDPRSGVVKLSDWDKLLEENYVKKMIVDAYKVESPFTSRVVALSGLAKGDYIRLRA